jgi:hypothetical protein
MKQTFEQFLQDICPCHTNNSPEGYENWLADLDVNDVMEYAESFGRIMYNNGHTDANKKTLEDIKMLKGII